ncbi:superoxide dismutase family protein [Capnocytophaga canimorsus]|uniref:superoxide dismutase family protein n=1 Tax=Capnocytophaga canimorsus TaxID=28188 RepID=UPI0037CE6B90
MKRFLVLGLVFMALGCKQTKKQPNNAEMISDSQKMATEKNLTVALTPKSDSNVSGTAVFTQKGDKVMLTVHVSGLTAGEHAIHLHEKADCSSADGTSTGGHWNPTFENHGKWGAPEGFHRGDIGNLTADENGNAHLEFETDLWCIGCDDDTKNIVGKAVIIHAATDDFVTQPTGNAGGRVSCGGIIE